MWVTDDTHSVIPESFVREMGFNNVPSNPYGNENFLQFRLELEVNIGNTDFMNEAYIPSNYPSVSIEYTYIAFLLKI